MTREEAKADLMLAQADIFYRPKDESIDMAIEALENQKTGHWITKVDKWGDVVTSINGYKCSVCGGKRIGETGEWIQIHECKYPYCPDCGAKMEGDKE